MKESYYYNMSHMVPQPSDDLFSEKDRRPNCHLLVGVLLLEIRGSRPNLFFVSVYKK